MKNKLSILFIFFIVGCVQSPKSNKRVTEADNSDVAPGNPAVNPTINPTLPPVGNSIDPIFFESWHLVNSGQSSFSKSGGLSGQDMKWSGVPYTGAGVLVAVSDNGIEKEHEDLSRNFNLGFSKNYANNVSGWYGDPVPSDSAHGTAVAGIIAASSQNGVGSRGVASQSILAGFKYVGEAVNVSMQVDQANGNYDIFNYSYGGYSCYFDRESSTYLAQLEYGVKNLRGGKGALYIKAAGNEYYSYNSDCDSTLSEDDDTYYLGNANLEQVHSYPWMIVVGAVNANGVSASYSTPGSSLWVSAPGGEYGVNFPAIITTDLSGCDRGYSETDSTRNDFDRGINSLNNNCNYTSAMNGTSAATPMISGAVALLLQANPNLSWRDIKYILAKTARKVDINRNNLSHPGGLNLSGFIYDRGWTRNAAGFNFHNWYGFGVVDISAAITLATNYNSGLATFKEAQISSSSNLNLSIPDNSNAGALSQLSIANNYSIEAVQLKLDIEHPFIGDLGIELTSPSGTTSTMMNINSGVSISNISNEVLLSNAFYGESSLGTWQLKIVDGQGQDVGTLKNWSIKIYGH